MADLIAIGCPDETTAMAAADEARRLARDLIIQGRRDRGDHPDLDHGDVSPKL